MSPISAPPSSSGTLSAATPTGGAAAVGQLIATVMGAPSTPPSPLTSPAPPGAGPPPRSGSFSDLLSSARTAPAEGQSKQGSSTPSTDIGALILAGFLGVAHPGNPAGTAPAPARPAAVASAAGAPATGAATPASPGATSAAGPAAGPADTSLTDPSARTAQSLATPAPATPAPATPAPATPAPATPAPATPAPATPAMATPAMATPAPVAPSAALSDSTVSRQSSLTAAAATATTPAATTAAAAAMPPPPAAATTRLAHATTSAADMRSAPVSTIADTTNRGTKNEQYDGSGSAGDGPDASIAQATVTQDPSARPAPGASEPTSAVPLSQASETLSTTVTAMTKQGLSQARISLSPDSLGDIKVVLTQTDNGLVARVVADHPEAAAALAENAGELRKSLEANGTTLARLDIGTSDQPSPGSAGSGSHDGGSYPGGSPYEPRSDADRSGGYGDLSDDDEDAASQTTQLTVVLGDGSMVNVLA